MRNLNIKELEDIVYGSAFYGGGGGGSLIEGLDLIKELKKEYGDNVELPMYSIDEMEDDPNVVSVMVAALGSPVATKGMLFIEESINAIKGMAEEATAQGKDLKYIYSGEQGGGNTLLPLYAAYKLGLPIIDTDANGRAVPELNTGLLPIHDIPTSPISLASGKGDRIIAKTNDPMDSKACENIARHMCMAYDMGIGFSAWLANKEDHLKSTAIGQMTFTQLVGNALRNSTAGDLASNLEKLIGNDKMVTIIESGEIIEKNLNTEGGFDDGTTKIKAANGSVYEVAFQNENLVVYDDSGKPIATVPDVIAIVDIGVEPGQPLCPLSNTETEVGQKVALFGIKAHDRWYDPNGYDCWRDVLKDAGYTGEKVDLV